MEESEEGEELTARGNILMEAIELTTAGKDYHVKFV